MILSTQATTSVKDVIAARGKPIWSQLYATNKFEVAQHHVRSMESQGSIAVAVTVDSNSNRLQEQALRMRRFDSRECASCHDDSSIAAAQRDKPMYDGADFSGLTSIRSSAMSWDYIKRLRDQTKMKMVLKGIMAWEDAKIAAEAGIDAIPTNDAAFDNRELPEPCPPRRYRPPEAFSHNLDHSARDKTPTASGRKLKLCKQGPSATNRSTASAE